MELGRVAAMEESVSEILYEDDGLCIKLHKALSLIQLIFKKTPDLEHFRNGYSLAMDAAAMRGVRYWLTDAQEIKSMYPENQVWLKQQMAPLLQTQLRLKCHLVKLKYILINRPPTAGCSIRNRYRFCRHAGGILYLPLHLILVAPQPGPAPVLLFLLSISRRRYT